MKWFVHFRPGDWLTLALGIWLTGWLASHSWPSSAAQKIIIRTSGQLFAEARLDKPQRIHVPGPLGESIVEIQAGRARVAVDPSPRQLCVKHGWLSRAGDAALCLPNQLSVEMVGAMRRFDSLNY